MPQAEKETERDEALRNYIAALEKWPEDKPPSPEQIRVLRRTHPLSESEQDKLERLVENHMIRGRRALSGRAYDQAAAELARAAQLQPLAPRPKVELAGVYLGKSLERGYERSDRRKALNLANAALELRPGYTEAKAFIRDYRKMNADFRKTRLKRYALPIVLAILALSALIWWQRDIVLASLRRTQARTAAPAPPLRDFPAVRRRNVELNTSAMDGRALRTQVLTSVVGRRDGQSYVHTAGRLFLEQEGFERLVLTVRGYDAAGNLIFTLPSEVHGQDGAPLYPGDSMGWDMFRWLEDSEQSVARMELSPSAISFSGAAEPSLLEDVTLVWDAPRPDGTSLGAAIRDWELIEAFDRQIVYGAVAVFNKGLTEIGHLDLIISLGPDLPDYPVEMVSSSDVPLGHGERRVRKMALGLPLDASPTGVPVTVRVKSAAEPQDE